VRLADSFTNSNYEPTHNLGGGVGLDLTCASDIDGGLRPSCGWTRDRGVARLRGAPAGKWGADIRVHLPGSGAGVGDRGMSTR
jgi:hypothetical protein